VLLRRLEFAWRIVGTGLAFAGFFGGGFALAIVGFRAIDLFTQNPVRRRERHHALIRWAFGIFISLVTRLGIIAVKLDDPAALKSSKGTIVVANHPSLLDVVLLTATIPRVQCIVKRALWASPFLGPVMRGNGYIPADLDPEALLVACRDALSDGRCLIVFPEGTRTQPGQPVSFQRGFAHIATLLDADIQLVLITCTPPAFTKGEKWWAVPPRRPVFQVSSAGWVRAESWRGSPYRSIAARRIVRHIERLYNDQLAIGRARD
jgi:1-acyl-sn-glycerol-3-phosphate acyltransferase